MNSNSSITIIKNKKKFAQNKLNNIIYLYFCFLNCATAQICVNYEFVVHKFFDDVHILYDLVLIQ